MANTNVHKPNYHTDKTQAYIHIYIWQKPLKLLKIAKGPIDKTFHKTSGFDSWQRISVKTRLLGSRAELRLWVVITDISSCVSGVLCGG